MLLPMDILGIWARGILSLMAPGLGVHLLGRWANRPLIEPERGRDAGTGPLAFGTDVHAPLPRVRGRLGPPVHGRLGFNPGTACLIGGLVLLGGSIAGSVVYRFLRRPGPDDPREQEGETSARGETEYRLRRPDGSILRVVCCGPEDAPVIVLTHGLGANSSEWHYAKARLADHYRLILWDLPGLGLSESPEDGDWGLETLAGHLEAVLDLAGDAPVILLGHSIGGMTVLTYCRLHPEALGTRVRGLVLVHTTYTNPVRTTSRAGVYTAIQKPILEPLCYLMIATSPLIRLMNALTYLNGSLYLSVDRGLFSGRETRQRLDFAARYYLVDRPKVIARGMLAMFDYDATDVLDRIRVPTLIVAGDRDISTKASASFEMARKIPDARLVVLSPARHMGQFEHPERFTDEVDRFVASCFGGVAGSGRANRAEPAPARGSR